MAGYGGRSLLAALAVTFMALCPNGSVWAASTLVADAKPLYQTNANPLARSSATGTCKSCHFQNDPPNATHNLYAGEVNYNNHPLAANNYQRILTAFGPHGDPATYGPGFAGAMTLYLGTNPINTPVPASIQNTAFLLSLWIGQYKLPVFRTDGVCTDANLRMKVRIGATATQDIFQCLKTDGTSGVAADDNGTTLGLLHSGGTSGSTITTVQNSGTSGGLTTLAYTISYAPPANFTVGNTESFVVQAVNSVGAATRTLNVDVYGISSAATATAMPGRTYDTSTPLYSITSNDGTATYAIAAGSPTTLSSLGSSVALNAATGQITGTVTAAPGTYTLRVQANITVTGAVGPVTKDVTVTVPSLTMKVGATDAGTTLAFNQSATVAIATHQASGTPASVVPSGSYTVTSGSFPTGLTFNTGNGQLTGIPTTSGSFSPAVSVNSNFGTLSQAFTINVASAGAPTVTTSPVLSTTPASPTLIGTRGTAVSAISINATNPSTNMSYGGTNLPAGLSVTGSQLTGTPTVSGDFAITLTATNGTGAGYGTGTVNANIRINPTAAPVISGTSAVSTNVNAAMTNYQITASNAPILSYALVSALPTGLSLNTGTGIISGTPTASGVVTTTVRAANPVGNSNDFPITFTIVPTAVPVVTIPSLPSPIGTRNSAITPIQISATNPAITGYNQTGFPTGLSINGSGQIVGTPTQSGDFPVLINATNAAGTSANLSVTLRVNPDAVPVISSSAAVSANANQPLPGGYQIVASNPPILSYALVGASTLPTGLSLNNSTGAITGTPTVSGPSSTTLSATNAFGTSSNFVVSWTIVPTTVPTVTLTLPSPLGTVGSAITPVQIMATNPAITGYGVTGSLPTGLSVNASGQIVGTPTQSGDFPVMVTATNASGTGSSGSLTVRISPNTVPTITSPAAVSRTVNAATGLVYQIAASNPLITAYAVVAPSVLPAGLTLNTATGAISGSPTASGIFTTTLSATNGVGTSAPFVLTFTINPTAVPVVTATVPAVAGTVGSPITPIQVNATNPAITGYSATGLPSGLSVDATGLLSGTPAQSGDFSVVLSATNAVGTGNSVAAPMRILPNAVPVISGASAVSTTMNQAFAGYQISASNLPISSFAVVAPSVLPAGLTLNTTTGAISGTATASGTVSTTLRATNNAGNSAPFVLTFTVVPTSVPVVSVTLPSPLGTVGSTITPVQIMATNPAITAYGATGLPAGLSVNVSGQIVGTPTQSGDFSVVFSATNVAGTGTATAMTIRISPNTVPAITSATAASGTVNSVFAGYQVTATNTPITSYALVAPGVLPAGLSLNTGTGAISGTPTVSGSFSIGLSASNAAGTSAPFALALTINPSNVPIVTGPTFATVAAGTPIAPIQITATNPAILGYSATGLPPGLVINTGTGTISGTPTTPGSYKVTLTANNAVGPGSLQDVPFTVGVPAPVACALPVALNTPTTLDLASCLFNGFAPTGVSIVATPAHGVAVANGTKVTYTPAHNYFGPDTFTFVGYGAGGTSPQGTVTVTVTGRPDPVQDAAVTALISAQTETAQRFSRAQMSNFQRRMESLHGNGPVGGQGAGASLRGGTTPASASAFATGGMQASASTSTAPHLRSLNCPRRRCPARLRIPAERTFRMRAVRQRTTMYSAWVRPCQPRPARPR